MGKAKKKSENDLEFDDMPWIAKTRQNRALERRKRFIEREQAAIFNDSRVSPAAVLNLYL